MISPEHRRQLLEVARESLLCGVHSGHPLEVSPAEHATELQQAGACFVTLHEDGALRGCIGSLEAHRPLVVDVAENAFAAGFRDPRFQALREAELERVSISISVLSKPVAMDFSSEQDLLKQLRVGIDGLVLEAGYHKGTFLPAVWAQLPQPEQFLRHLKRKAGLAEDYWADNIHISRYQSESFDEHSAA